MRKLKAIKLKANKKRLLALVVMLILLAIFLVEFSLRTDYPIDKQEDVVIKEQNKQENVSLEIGRKAPDFVLQDIYGKKITLSQFAGNKPVILNFWATWCPPCKQEMPLLQKYYDKHKDGIEIIAVNMQEDPTLVKDWIKDFEITYTILLDPAEKVKQLYNIYAKPTTYFIDKKGIIRAKKLGQLSEDELSPYIKEILS